jgi:ribosomal protein S18 acetylase RimI-like enzyme
MTSALHIRLYEDADYENVVALWDKCGLLRPWNDPAEDIALCQRTASSELWVGVFGKNEDPTTLVATIMTGSDGHRGWLYYLAVDQKFQRNGFARAMVRYAEDWLAGQGIRKVELMIRDDNEPVRAFYERVGYETEPRTVMSRWLRDHDT